MRALTVLVLLLLAGCGGGEPANPPAPSAAAPTITVTSTAFTDNQPIPAENTCSGAGTPPQLAWTGIPAAAKSAALVVTDPDAPSGTFIHWVLYDLPPKDARLTGAPAGAKEADNSGGSTGWTAPCPPSGTHHYIFTVYALSAPITAQGTQPILDQITTLAIAQGRLTGLVSSG